ncbi:hypothetical protein MKW92_052393 [Papaver armeniacum]|nr:hypothetical protein MKW92_052393 [Papaver armeniacum]
MDIGEDAMAAHKRTFGNFLDQDIGKSIYMEAIREMIDGKRYRLLIDISDLHDFNSDLTRRLLRNPGDYIQPFSEALTEVTRNIDPKYLKEGESILCGFEGAIGDSREVTPRGLLSSFIGSMVRVKGIVTKCSLVRPKVVKSVHFCPTTTQFTTREYRDITSSTGLPTGSVYPTRDDNGNLLVTEYGLCKYKDHQMLSMQEVPEEAAPGQIPRTVDIIVEDDLVDACKPGDRVAIVGIYKALPGRNKGGVNGVLGQTTVLIANNVSLLNKEANKPTYNTEDLRNIKNIAAKDDAFDLLGSSLAPSIYGHTWIKKAVILDINMMMVGDPSVAKSQLLRAILNIAPLAISTTGRGSSGVGLTAAVTSDQETGERRLEAGAMVLADKGVVCIDEFDKMNDQDRVAIHEVMEQQTVTIAKAGIHASLNARCSVVAAANPIYGTYDRSITPTKNIGLPDSLLSRFDLLFIVLDQMDPDIDRQISEHVLRMHRYRSPNDGGDGRLRSGIEEDTDTGSSFYVKYNRAFMGKETQASEQIATAYAELRNAGSNAMSGGGTLPITARTLETIIRLSTAHAKLKLRSEVTKDDVDSALKVLNFAIYHKELAEMEERELVREKELAKKQKADRAADTNNRASGGETADPMEVDEPPTAPQATHTLSPERIEAFGSVFGQHMRANHLDLISIADIENVVNAGAAVQYTRLEIVTLLERLQEDNRLMINDDMVHMM